MKKTKWGDGVLLTRQEFQSLKELVCSLHRRVPLEEALAVRRDGVSKGSPEYFLEAWFWHIHGRQEDVGGASPEEIIGRHGEVCVFGGCRKEELVEGEGILTVGPCAFLVSDEARKRLSMVCSSHADLTGATPVIRHPTTGTWCPGKIIHVFGKSGQDHPFYTWVRWPVGVSAKQAAELQLPACEFPYADDVILRGRDLFPRVEEEDILWDGLGEYK
jgi:hypothetical protein